MRTLRNLLWCLIVATIVSLAQTAWAAQPSDFAGAWTCNWQGRVDVGITVAVGEKIDVTYTWPYSSLWAIRYAGESKTEGEVVGEKLVFSFKYTDPRASDVHMLPTKVTLWFDRHGKMRARHEDRMGLLMGKCKKK